MTTAAEALKGVQDAVANFRTAAAAEALSVESKVRDAKAILDSATGEQAQHAAMVALAAIVDTALKGESVVSSVSPAKFRLYVYGAGAVVLAGLLAFAHWGLKLF